MDGVYIAYKGKMENEHNYCWETPKVGDHMGDVNIILKLILMK
jgi:hypothetical protein